MERLNRIIFQPLIGATAVVVHSPNPTHLQISGRIIDETHATITLFDGTLRRILPKSQTLFDITWPKGTTTRIEGVQLLGHPAERLRRAKRQRW